MTHVKILHYLNVYLNRPDPIVFLPLTVDTTVRLYDDFIRLFFLYDHREELFWLLNCRRNLIIFVSFWLIEGCCWFDHDEDVGYPDFNPPGPFISVIHVSSSFHSFKSSHSDPNSFPRTFSSTFCPSGTCRVFILAFHWLLCSSELFVYY